VSDLIESKRAPEPVEAMKARARSAKRFDSARAIMRSGMGRELLVVAQETFSVSVGVTLYLSLMRNRLRAPERGYEL